VRFSSSSWIDSSNNLYLFGGYGYSTDNSGWLMNDLWKWDGQNWTWIYGSNATTINGTYGTKGVPSSSIGPGSRRNGLTWRDSSGDLYMFGGYGYNGSGSGWLNDVWRFSIR
jgi:N-acetylneuraminic acid mutarotase